MKKFKKIIIIPTMLLTLGTISSFSNVSSNKDEEGESVVEFSVRKVGPETTKASSSNYCLLTFTPNVAGSTEGSFKDGEYIKKFEVRKGHNWARIKDKGGIPTGDSLQTSVSTNDFKGWINENKFIDNYYTFDDDTVTLSAKWGEKYNPDPADFASDTWEQFIQTANKGFNELTTKYTTAYTYGGYNTFAIKNLLDTSEVAAKTRYVEIKGLTCPVTNKESYGTNKGKWPVRVVAENHDKIYNSLNQVAPLTFEFAYVVNPSVSWDYTGLQGHQSWNDSTLKKYLNTYLYYQIEDVVQSGIQYVSKNTDNGYGINEVNANKEILFLNSTSELCPPKEALSLYENSQYKYYTIHTDAGDRIKYNPYDLDTDGNPKAISTWIRTPNLTRGKNSCKAYAIDSTTGNLNALDTKTSIGVAPCFAVGIEERTSYQFSGTSALSMTPIDPYGTKANGFSAKINLEDEAKYDLPTETPTVTYNGNPLTKDVDYTYADGVLDIKAEKIEDTGKLYITAIPGDNKFKTDSWDTLISYANKGIDALKERYGYSDFVGKIKYITVDGIQYKTRVIGQAEDTLTDGTGKAALTFQFETVLKFSDGSQTLAYDDNDATTFENSKLNKSLEAFLSYMPDGLRKVNKTITHKEIEPSGDTSGFRNANISTKLFPLSFTEVNLSNKVSHAVQSEGTTYSYYKNEGSKYSPELYKFIDNRTYTEVPIWLRSPATNKNADYINIDSEIKQDKNVTNSSENYVAPAFCIGATKVEHTITFKGEDYTSNDSSFSKTMKAVSGEQFILKKIHSTDNLLPLDESSCYIRTTKNREFTDFKFKFDSVTKTYTLSIMKMPDEDLDITFASKGPLKLSIMNSCSSEASINVLLTKSTKVTTDIKFDYSTDGVNFNEYTSGSKININNKVVSPATKKVSAYFRANEVNKQISIHSGTTSECTHFSFDTASNSPKVMASGNIMALFNKNCKETMFYADGGINALFRECTNLYDASSLLIGGNAVSPTASSGHSIFRLIFESTNVIDAPFKFELNSEVNCQNLFEDMFRYNANLVGAPTLKCDGMHASMLQRTFAASNSALKYAPNLEIGNKFFNGWYLFRYCFSGCVNMKTAPDYIGLKGQAMGSKSEYAFSGCTSLEKSPIIGFSNLSGAINDSYYRFFQNCSSLKYARFINIESINENKYVFYETFKNCNSLNTIVIEGIKNGFSSGWNDTVFYTWLIGCSAPSEQGTHYIYLNTVLCNQLLAKVKSSGYSNSRILSKWGIRNIDTGEEVLGPYAQ